MAEKQPDTPTQELDFDKAFDEFAKQHDASASPTETPTQTETPPKVEAEAAPTGSEPTETPPKTETEPTETPPKAAKGKTKEEDPEWFAALPKEAQDEILRLRNNVKVEQGRVRQLREQQKAAPTPAPKTDEPKTTDFRQSESWKSLVEKFPDIASAVEAAVSGVQNDVTSVKEAVGPLQKEREESSFAKAKAVVDEKYDGWTEAVKAPEFKDWFDQQSPGVQMLAKSPDPRDALLMLDRYANDTGHISARKKEEPTPQKKGTTTENADEKAAAEAAALKAKREQQLRDAAGPTGSAPSSGERTTVPDDFDTAFSVFAKKADTKLASLVR